MVRIGVIFIFLLLFTSGGSLAEVYQWLDERGAVHFTDDITLIPEKYKGSTKPMDVPVGSGDVKKDNGSAKVKKEDNYRDQLGRGEQYWKDRVEQWRKRLKSLEERVEHLRTKYNELTEKVNSTRGPTERTTLRKEREGVKAELDQARADMEEARTMLEKKIPEESEIYKAKPEWLKP
jgi:uncharacterized protein YydD (DUF2326 family)